MTQICPEQDVQFGYRKFQNFGRGHEFDRQVYENDTIPAEGEGRVAREL